MSVEKFFPHFRRIIGIDDFGHPIYDLSPIEPIIPPTDIISLENKRLKRDVMSTVLTIESTGKILIKLADGTLIIEKEKSK